MKVGYVYDPIYLEHDTGQHPENRQRLEAIISHLETTGLIQQLTLIPPRAATVEEILLVHDKELLSSVYKASEFSRPLDADTVVSPRSYEAARYAAGGVIKAADAVMQGQVNSAFALVRPPGHHATPHQAMGFCLFNNIAIAAKYAFQQYRLERLAIIDFDVHHGNGTNDTFYDDPRLLYVSTHQYPHYPGSGNLNEIGAGAARGTKVNIPLPAGCGDAEFDQVFTEIITPVVRRFRPQLIMVSAGYDPHWADELAMMQVSVHGFADMVSVIRSLAEALCDGKMVFALEGGYNLNALAASVKATFDVLLGNPVEDPIGPPPHGSGKPDISELVRELQSIHNLDAGM